MASAFSGALAVKELEPGEWHWVILKEAPFSPSSEGTDEQEEPLCFIPDAFSDPHANAAAAWAAGYLAIRAAMRKAVGN